MKLKIVNFDEDFDERKLLTSSDPIKNKAFAEDGIYSESLFGDYHKANSDLERAWIEFGDNYVINPIIFSFVKKVFNQKRLMRILKADRTIDTNGDEILDNELDNIGLVKFRKHFKKYLKEYGNKDIPEYEFLLKNLDLLFINKLPVFSPKLRPAMLINGKEARTASDYGEVVNFIIKYSNELKNSDADLEGDLQINKLLFSLQEYCNKCMKLVVDDFLRKKKGWFRNNILGSRIDYSARCVITPLIGYRNDEVILPYKIYMELYKKLLINIIANVKGLSYVQASLFWRKCLLSFNPEMYGYIKELNKKTKGGQFIILNRNPTISIGSILRLRIVDINPNYDDLTLQISNNILSSLSADYDGDVLNIIPLFNQELKDAFSCFSPERLLVSADTGKFNTDFFLEKEQKLGIYVLNN